MIALLTFGAPAATQAAKPFFSATVGISNLCYAGNFGGQDQERVAVNLAWNGSYQINRITVTMDGSPAADQSIPAAASGTLVVNNSILVIPGTNHTAQALFYAVKRKQGFGPYSSGPVLVTQLAPC
jgi:hypothetical protein